LSLRPCINGDRPIEAWREEEGQADGGDREIVCALAVAAAERFYGASAQSLYLALLYTPRARCGCYASSTGWFTGR